MINWEYHKSLNILIRQKDKQLRNNSNNFNNLNNILNNIYLIDEKIKQYYLLIEKENKIYKNGNSKMQELIMHNNLEIDDYKLKEKNMIYNNNTFDSDNLSEHYNKNSFDNFLDLFNNLYLDDYQNKLFFKKNINDNNEPKFSIKQPLEEIKNKKDLKNSPILQKRQWKRKHYISMKIP